MSTAYLYHFRKRQRSGGLEGDIVSFISSSLTVVRRLAPFRVDQRCTLHAQPRPWFVDRKAGRRRQGGQARRHNRRGMKFNVRPYRARISSREDPYVTSSQNNLLEKRLNSCREAVRCTVYSASGVHRNIVLPDRSRDHLPLAWSPSKVQSSVVRNPTVFKTSFKQENFIKQRFKLKYIA